MKAIAIHPGTAGTELMDFPEPAISSANEIALKVLEVGICGTDREEVNGGRAKAPVGEHELVIGHEMFGRVVKAGSGVRNFKVGDYAVLTVRRGCGKCASCKMGRADMCQTGGYKERGIKEMHGYQAETVVDQEQYAVKVPEKLKSWGVLSEPFSVSEKAISEAFRIQYSRLPEASDRSKWLQNRRCLVAGLGPVGLLAALALRLRGADVTGLDIVDVNTTRPRWLNSIGGKYIDGRVVSPDHVDDQLGPMDLIFEATGVASLEFNLLDALAANGIYVLTGIPSGDRPLKIPGAQLVRQLVLDNQVMFGSVNATRDHFQMAVNDMLQADLRWEGILDHLITNRFAPEDHQKALFEHPVDEIKSVIVWGKGIS